MGQEELFDFCEPSSQRLPPGLQWITANDCEDEESKPSQWEEEELIYFLLWSQTVTCA
jgi:hypothetical protein